MFLFYVIFFLLSLSISIKEILKIKIEEALTVSLFGTFLLLYIFGLFNLLKFGLYFTLIITIATFINDIILIIKRKIKIKEIITLPLIIYIIIIFIIYHQAIKLNFVYYDEFMFWGTNLKTMFSYDLLWAEKSIDGIHLVYPPFTALAEYFFLKIHQEFNEGIAYFGIILLIISSLLPILKNETYSIKSFFKVIFIFISIVLTSMLFNFLLANLSVDLILGVVFGVIMYLVYEADNKKDYIVISILMASITLMKPNGILFAGIGIMQLFFKKLFYLFLNRKSINKKEIIKNFSGVFILLLLIISTSLSWKTYYTLNGKKLDDRHDKNTTKTINVKEFINASLLNGKASKRNTQISRDFYKNIKEQQIIKKDSFNSCLSILLIVNLIYLAILIISKNKVKTISNFLSINIGWIMYIYSNLLVFMFIFQKNQGEMLMGFDRYIATYMLAMVLNLIFLVINKRNILSFIAIIIYLLLIKSSYDKNIYRPEINNIIKENAKIITENVKKDDKVFIIDHKLDYGSEFVATKYLISPIKTNLLYEWNISQFDNNIYYRLSQTKEDFKNLLIEGKYDYIFIIYVNYTFLEDYQELFTKDAKKKIKTVSNPWIKSNGILLKIDEALIK